ncbi:hypothetical protein [Paenibacillus sp. Marseille-Q4541]|uniref:hypothetical protein n=1 Tax=Paenibacillus sp. Marseille-Q4541 TaxID=2831522 RepID=UPI001BA4AB1E|nr:hypothetical protein [Paenibacillus sp. Marseille-Q4541]
MENKPSNWILVILCVIGILTIGGWVWNIGETVVAKFDSNLDFELRQEEFIEQSKSAYSYGRFWGKETAQQYELDSIENHNFNDNLSHSEVISLAKQLYEERAVDFFCWGADDCAELPTYEELRRKYKVDFGSPNMPTNAFESGYVDAFLEYIW